jgi:energy-coupling factor transporter ATP-binding protein EcfA2
MSSVLELIAHWSIGRPPWQREALRLLITTDGLTEDEVGNLTSVCKATHGLDDPRALRPLTLDDVASTSVEAEATLLLSLTHHSGVNALATEQTLRFGQNLTVVYGQNAAGKSGFTRILKRACRSRGREEVLGNVLSDDKQRQPSATINYTNDVHKSPSVWNYDSEPAAALFGVNVFDSHCAPVYVRDKTDVAFRPFGLDLFDKLSVICDQIRGRIEQEQGQVLDSMPRPPELPANTRARALVDSLTGLTKDEDVKRLATLTESENQRLTELRSLSRNLQTANPKQRAQELTLRGKRLQVLVEDIKRLQKIFGDAGLSTLRAALEEVLTRRNAMTKIRDAAFSSSLLPGTGDESWLKLWGAAAAFSGEAYPNDPFPVTKEAALCPLCQQSLAAEASSRLAKFAEFVASQAQASLREAELQEKAIISQLATRGNESKALDLALEELRVEDPGCAHRVQLLYSEAERIRAAALAGEKPDSWRLPDADLVAEVTRLVERSNQAASELLSGAHELSAEDSAEVMDLEARVLLAEHISTVSDIIGRKRILAAYRQCLDDTVTTAITRKSTELTKARVTEQLRSAFRDELKMLSFTDLPLELKSAGGAKGALFHRIAFLNAPAVSVSSILSEGESRALSLAGFLAELSTSANRSTIVFDDPVSSLDHIWREKLAVRLAAEAKVRQVIVFTHDIVFFRALMDESARLSLPTHYQYIRREAQPGLCSADSPWVAMRVKERIAKLFETWEKADARNRGGLIDEYESLGRELCGRTRDAWEQAVVEVLLNDVVEIFRPSIQTQRLRDLSDITAEDCDTVRRAMTACSGWIPEHDRADAKTPPLPEPGEIKKLITDLDAWVRSIEVRRRKGD